ncbi:MAG: 30S ribosomal protein S4 [SAR324 cluster bacterium]|nr:30S ribosomal protein S4 [SAR324 cluster bacterium]
MKLFRGAKGKLVRKLGINIFDTDRYDKVLERRPTPPGQHGSTGRRPKHSEYGKQLLEKQKLKFAHGITERQFRNIFIKASKMKGAPGVNLMQSLERRLDSVIFRSGFANSRPQARQMVNHGHFLLNDKKANIPSMTIKDGDKVTVHKRACSSKLVQECAQATESRLKMPWLDIDSGNQTIVFVRTPKREEIPILIKEQLIVELYSR